MAAVTLYYDSSRGTAEASFDEATHTLTVIATPKDSNFLERIVQTCDQGNNVTKEYHTQSRTVFTSTGHSSCRTIAVTVQFSGSRVDSCTIDAIGVNTPQVTFVPASRTGDVQPGTNFRASFTVTVAKGYVARYYRVNDGEKTHYLDMTGTFGINCTLLHRRDHESGAYHRAVFTVHVEKRSITLQFRDEDTWRKLADDKKVKLDAKAGALPRARKADHWFVGWYCDRVPGGWVTEDTVFDTATFGDDYTITLLARWKPCGPIVYGRENEPLHGSASKVLYLGDAE